MIRPVDRSSREPAGLTPRCGVGIGADLAPSIARRDGYGWQGNRMFSNTTEYALRAAVYVASLGGQSVRSERIAEVTKVPSGYISKVMRDLVVAGLVTSQRGPNGGFALARPAEAISVLDVVNAVTPIHRITSCPLGNPEHLNLCPLHRRLDDAIAGIERAFSATTLAEIVGGSPARGAGPSCAALTIDRQPVPEPARSKRSRR